MVCLVVAGIRQSPAIATGHAAAPAVRALLADRGLPDSYRSDGIDFVRHPDMVAQVLPQFSSSCNPRTASLEDVQELYERLAG